MDDREFERLLERLMGQDFSIGTEAFRDELLERCLAVLEAGAEGAPIDDADLELLAAAGDSSMLNSSNSLDGEGIFGDNGAGAR